MCGIAGILDLRGQRPIDPARLAHMNACLRHRGPDGEGSFFAPGIALGHRRLAVIDIAGGRQPLFNENGHVVVVFNGEIYNHRDLAAELSRRGHLFRTRCDTEVIVHAWEEWGEDCISHFRGMFAFAIWDKDRSTLFLARDRLGKKPLYYAATADGLIIFASEIDAVLAAMPEEPPLEPQAVEDYFALGYVPDPKTIYRGVHKLPPAHRLCLRRGEHSSTPKAYWDARFGEDTSAGLVGRAQVEAASDLLLGRMQEAVSLRLKSDVPLGAFLSGGIDSSTVVALMSEMSASHVQTYSIGFKDPRFDESRHASETARCLGTRHESKIVQPDACSAIDRLAEIFGEPFADDSALPTMLLCQLARRRVTVALSGDGGDEVFAGYPRYAAYLREERAKRPLPLRLRRPVFGALARIYPRLDRAPRAFRAKAVFEAFAQDGLGGYFRAVTILPDCLRERLYSSDFRATLHGYHAIEVLREHASRAGISHPVALAQYLDLKTVLPAGMLTKVDRASMAHALEIRSPLLDQELVEWAATLPVGLKLRGSEGKRILKAAMRRHLPASILTRPKQGFSMPLSAWLRGELSHRLADLIDRSALLDSGFVARRALQRMTAEHASGFKNHGRALWSLLMFDAFLRRRGHRRAEMPVREHRDETARLELLSPN